MPPTANADPAAAPDETAQREQQKCGDGDGAASAEHLRRESIVVFVRHDELVAVVAERPQPFGRPGSCDTVSSTIGFSQTARAPAGRLPPRAGAPTSATRRRAERRRPRAESAGRGRTSDA